MLQKNDIDEQYIELYILHFILMDPPSVCLLYYAQTQKTLNIYNDHSRTFLSVAFPCRYIYIIACFVL
jgi:hypothetical protein